VGAYVFIPRPWIGSAQSGRRPSAHPAWRRCAARQVPGLVGSPPAWDRSDQRTRCRRRKRSNRVGSYREFSGSPRKTWPGYSGSVPPGNTGHWTRRPCRAGRGRVFQEVGGATTPGLPRAAVDLGHLRHFSQVFRDAAKKASTAASEGTPVPGRGAAVALALSAAQGPFPGPASAGVPAPPETGSGTSGERPRMRGVTGLGPALTVAASPAARPARPRSQRAAERRRPKSVPSTGHRGRQHARRAPSPPPSGPPSSTESDKSPPGSSSDPSGADSTDNSNGSTSSSATGSDPGATRRRGRARAADKRPQRALVQEALREFRREQR